MITHKQNNPNKEDRIDEQESDGSANAFEKK